MSNYVYNFSLLAVVVSKILGGPKFTLGALCPMDATPKRLLYHIWDIRESQIHISRPYTPWTPPSGKIFVPETITLPHLMASLISNFLA